MPGNIGLPEIILVLIIALVIFGPKRLPELGRSLGNGLREFKSSITGEGRDDDEDEPPRQIENGIEEPITTGAPKSREEGEPVAGAAAPRSPGERSPGDADENAS